MAPDDCTTTRRRFLEATATASVTALAGCNESGDGTASGSPMDSGTSVLTTETTLTPTETTPTTTTPSVDFDSYPYGVGESKVEAARTVMEDAGYGPGNRYQLRWHQYRSPSYDEMADTISSRLEQAHVDMRVESSWYVQQAARKGVADAFTLGWVADYPAAENFLRQVDPPNTDYHGANPTATGEYLYWTADSHHGEGRTQAIEAVDRLQNNPESTEEAAQTRATAVRQLEEALWADVPMVMNVHGYTEPAWHDRVEWRPSGGLGESRQKKTRIAVAGHDRLSLINETMVTLDPVAATDTASETVITQLFDALMNFRNGTTTVDPLLIEDFTTSEDFTTYTFTLKDGVQFHDGRELTAADVVYSFRRLAESEHSNRVEHLADVLGVSHRVVAVKRNDSGNALDQVTIPSTEFRTEKYADYDREQVVPESIAVEATGDYEVRIGLDRPFAHTLSLLAFPAFSVVPEGIVGDVEGYEGDVEYVAFATQNPVGCGPFVLGEWTQGEDVAVDRFEGYHGSDADVEGVDWRIIEDANAAYDYFVNGNADIGVIPTSRYSREKVSIDRTDARGRQLGTYGPLETGETVNYAKVPGLSTFYVGFNCESVPLPVRKAVAYVTNMEGTIREIFQGHSIPAYHLTPPTLFPGGPDGYDRHYQE